MHAPFLWHASGAENTKTARASGRLFDETRFRNSVFRASSGSAAQGTVASPGPVAGSDVTIGPLLMLVHLLSVAIGRCQRYSGTVTRHDSQGGSFLSHPRKRRVHNTSPVLGSIRQGGQRCVHQY